MNKDDKPVVLSVKEAADLVGVHVQTMYEMAHAGKAPFDRVGVGRGRLVTSEAALRETFPNIMKKRSS